MIRVAVAEEQRIARWALAEALGKTADFEMVGQAGTVEETLQMISDAKPDVLVLQPMLPDHSGLDVLGKIRQIATAPRVVVLAPFAEPGYAARAIDAGAHAYVAKTAGPEELINAIRAVAHGEKVIVPAADNPRDSPRVRPLTGRESQVMEMLARGMRNREIAEHLDIGIKTVDTHRGNILKKLGVRNNAELARFAVKHGYVTLMVF